MNKEQKKEPATKVKVRVRRTSENSCASAQAAILEEMKPDLIEAVLPEAIEEELRAESAENKTEEKKEEPIKFVSVTNIEELKTELPPEAEENIVRCVEKEEAVDKAENIQEKKTEELSVVLKEEIQTEKQKQKLFTPFSKMSLIRKILTVLCVIFCCWSLIPAVCNIIGIGLYAPLFIGLFFLFTVTAWDFIASVKSGLWKFMWFIISVVVMAGAVAFAFVSGHMIAASNNTVPAYNSDVTVVVLGCKVRGTQPSKMLQGRLDAAAEYLLTHPGVNCIVAGGMGGDESLPEAVVMKQYLVEKGVSASRIKTEDRSTSTKENLENAIDVAQSNNYYTTFCIVTDRFHQLRASMMCKDLGITSYALSCETPWYLTMYYWFREMFGIAHYTVYKN